VKSLFAPAVSFLAAPGYALGKLLGASQVGAFTTIAVFALLNCYFIYQISRLLGANKASSLIAMLFFIFGTPSFSYAVTLYQHHISTFLILISLFLLIKYKTFLSLGFIWFFCALSISVDYPNLILMFPIGLFALGRIVGLVSKDDFVNVKIRILC